MRLLDTQTRKLENFEGQDVPLYAILSHRWEETEVTFQDMQQGDATEKPEYKKIRMACDCARQFGYSYLWIDTCCIDKTSSAELSEAINSMFQWYQDAGVCLAYLADVSSNASYPWTHFAKSKWFTRGWTLQELIAPSSVLFFNRDWQEICTKSNQTPVLAEITRIPVGILRGNISLEDASIAARMSWASERVTTRIEDRAYSLMGLFNIHMPLIYGEGEKAFIRLQEEILKTSDDHSLFAWESSESHGGLLATSPAAFSRSSQITSIYSHGSLIEAITVNNRGIHLKLPVQEADQSLFRGSQLAILPCRMAGPLLGGKGVGIYVDALPDDEHSFIRTHTHKLELVEIDDHDRYLANADAQGLVKAICVQQRKPAHRRRLPLTTAAEKGDMSVVRYWLQRNVSIESRDGSGRTALSWAAGNGHRGLANLLLAAGADIESEDYYGRTPVSWAAHRGQLELVILLVGDGATSSFKSKDLLGRTPLVWAAMGGHEDVVRFLLEKEAAFEFEDEHGHTPLLWAAYNGYVRVVELLLESGADIERKDRFGRTPLVWAAMNGREEVVKLLLGRGANAEVEDRYGQTPISWADVNGYGRVKRLLRIYRSGQFDHLD